MKKKVENLGKLGDSEQLRLSLSVSPHPRWLYVKLHQEPKKVPRKKFQWSNLWFVEVHQESKNHDLMKKIVKKNLMKGKKVDGRSLVATKIREKRLYHVKEQAIYSTDCFYFRAFND